MFLSLANIMSVAEARSWKLFYVRMKEQIVVKITPRNYMAKQSYVYVQVWK